MKKISLVLALVAALSASFANATAVTGKVTKIATTGIGDNQDFYVTLAPVTGGGTAACGANTFWFTTLDGAHPNTLELVKSAYIAGKTVKFTGINLCKNNGEILKDIVLQ